MKPHLDTSSKLPKSFSTSEIEWRARSRKMAAVLQRTFHHACSLLHTLARHSHTGILDWPLCEPQPADSWVCWLRSSHLSRLMANAWVSWKGCGRCSARLDGYIVPWVFLSIFCALTAPCCIPELWQALTAHLPLAWHGWSDCTTHSVTSHDVTDTQRSRSTGCLRTGPVKSSRCYLYPANITGWDFSTSKCPTLCWFSKLPYPLLPLHSRKSGTRTNPQKCCLSERGFCILLNSSDNK